MHLIVTIVPLPSASFSLHRHDHRLFNPPPLVLTHAPYPLLHLHISRYVLAKERNLLQSEKLAYASLKKPMPNSSRLFKVKKGMNRIKQVMSERIREHEDPTMKMHLKAFIDSM